MAPAVAPGSPPPAAPKMRTLFPLATARHTELHGMAEARLEAYQRKFVALELNAIADAKFQDPHLHMRRVRHHVEASMKDRAAEV